MNCINISKINISGIEAKEIPALFQQMGTAYHKVTNVNWPAAFPYCPSVEFAIVHTADTILLHYRVEEQSVRAVAAQDNDNVWEDSCAEFFISPASDGLYYNFECNCTGKLLLGVGAGRNERELASPLIMHQVDRWASLGITPFNTCEQDTRWELALCIPYSAFFRHHVTSLDGCTVRGNFYKCGDKLPVPHFISWSPIQTPQPDFHCPAWFGELAFQ
jgi:hypothetical protein